MHKENNNNIIIIFYMVLPGNYFRFPSTFNIPGNKDGEIFSLAVKRMKVYGLISMEAGASERVAHQQNFALFLSLQEIH